jgi:hypothetical protein
MDSFIANQMLRESDEVIAKLRADRDALLAAAKEFDVWFDGWCPSHTCCALSGRPIAERVRAAIVQAES